VGRGVPGSFERRDQAPGRRDRGTRLHGSLLLPGSYLARPPVTRAAEALQTCAYPEESPAILPDFLFQIVGLSRSSRFSGACGGLPGGRSLDLSPEHVGVDLLGG